MVDIGWRLLALTAKLAIFSVSVFAFGLLLTLIINGLIAGLNFGVINDLVGLVQIWLPFNLGVVIAWLFTVAFAYFAFRVSVIAMNYTNEFLK